MFGPFVKEVMGVLQTPFCNVAVTLATTRGG